MDRRELLSRIATFPLVARDLSEDLLSGNFRSVFKGQGIEFDEVRRYEQGDDAGSIDWNVSARFGSPYIKLFREERELTVFIVLDSSASMDTGSGPLSRREQAVLTAALIALSAEKAGERVGCLMFGGTAERLFPPKKGRAHALALVNAAVSLAAPPEGSGEYARSITGALGRALTGTARLLKRRSLVIVISDFLCIHWERDLGYLARKHDLLAIRVSDPVDTTLPDAGLVLLRDPESGEEMRAPTSFSSFRDAWNDYHEDHESAWRTSCARRNAACLNLSTADDPVLSLSRFFGSRRRA